MCNFVAFIPFLATLLCLLHFISVTLVFFFSLLGFWRLAMIDINDTRLCDTRCIFSCYSPAFHDWWRKPTRGIHFRDANCEFRMMQFIAQTIVWFMFSTHVLLAVFLYSRIFLDTVIPQNALAPAFYFLFITCICYTTEIETGLVQPLYHPSLYLSVNLSIYLSI